MVYHCGDFIFIQLPLLDMNNNQDMRTLYIHEQGHRQKKEKEIKM